MSYNNDGYSKAEIMTLQKWLSDVKGYDIEADGYWGPASKAATKMSAEEAMALMKRSSTLSTGDFSREMQTIMAYLGQGQDEQAENRINYIWDRLTEDQKTQARAALQKNGIYLR